MSVRIYQLARQLKLENKKVIELLQKQKLDVSSPSNTIDDEIADKFIKEFLANQQKTSKEPEVKKVAEAPKQAVKAQVPASKKIQIAVPVKPKQVPLVEKKLEVEKPAISKPTEKAKPAEGPKILVKSAQQVLEERAKEAEKKRATVTSFEKKRAPEINFNKPKFAPKLSAPKITLPPIAPKKRPSTQQFVQNPEQVEQKSESKVSQEPKDSQELKRLVIKPPIVVRELAGFLDVKPFRLISELMKFGVFASMNQSIDENIAQKIAKKYGFDLAVKHRNQPKTEQVDVKKEKTVKEKPVAMDPRAPVVCILGHVDHGKTTLLDYLRNTKVVDKEAGGITQHIGAYQVESNGRNITFLDTPGHAAFSKMRERGANVTDIAILIVAADDGFMPQTDEALKFAQKANIPVVVAINKIDAKGANVDRVKQQMQKRGIAPEEWGGETLCAEISALKGKNIDALLELILLQSEMLELKADFKCKAEGVIVESQVEIGKGSTSTAIIQKGTLKVGDALVCGEIHCKAKALFNDKGQKVKEAIPSTPVRILGWSSTPDAGAIFKGVKNEKEARRLAEENSRQAIKVKDSGGKLTNLESLMAAIESQKNKVLKVLIRADVHGSSEALAACLEAIKSEKVSLEIISAEVGMISKSDIQMANAANASIVGFNTKLENGVSSAAKHFGIQIIQHNIIYELLDKVKDAMADLLDPEFEEQKLGAAEIRQVFPLSKGSVAGCMVVEGQINRDASARLIRKSKVIHEGRIQMLKRFKDNATEVKSGYECGVSLSGNPSFQEGDVIECFEIVEKRPSL